MIQKIYSEWYDQEEGLVFSITEIRFLGIPIYNLKTTSSSWNVISGYIAPEEQSSGLYTKTNLGYKKTNEQET